jgi:uncharacterized protein YehS (DUF1456 family)
MIQQNYNSAYNSAYKKVRIIAKKIGIPNDRKLFELGGLNVSNAELHAWRAGKEHKHFRPIKEYQFLAYLEGLIRWIEENKEKF